MKKLVYIIYPIISVIISILLVFVADLNNGWLELHTIIALGIWFLMLIPISSFMYSHIILRDFKTSKRILFALLNSALIILPYFIITGTILAIFIPFNFMKIVCFSWGFMWSLLGLIGKRDNKNIKEQSYAVLDDIGGIDEEYNKSGKVGRFLFPIASLAISVVLQFMVWAMDICGFDAAMYFFHFSWLLIFMPISSFIYSKLILNNCKKRWIYTLYHSLIVSFSYILFRFVIKDALFERWGLFATFNSLKIIDAAIYFTWSEMWALIGLIRKRPNNEPVEQ